MWMFRNLRNRPAVRTPSPPATSMARGTLIPRWDRGIPDLRGHMSLVRQPERLPAGPRRNLEYIAVMVVVVRHHVEHVDALDLYLRQIPRLAVRQAHLQRPFDQPLAQVSGAKAVGRELLAGEMNEPD